MATDVEKDLQTPKTGISGKGAFFEKLNRNNSLIKSDRAQAILEDAQMFYKREIEDMQVQYRRYQREQENAFDLSPTSRDSLTPAKFDAKQWCLDDLKTTVDLVNLKKKIDAALERYAYLFGENLPA